MSRLWRGFTSLFLPEVVNPNDPPEETRPPRPGERLLFWGCLTGLILAGLGVAIYFGGVLLFAPSDFGTTAVAFSPDGETLAVGLAEGDIVLIDTGQQEVTQRLAAHTGWVWALAFDPTGEQIASAGTDGQVVLWDRATGAPIRRWQPYPVISPDAELSPGERPPLSGYYPVYDVAFSPDGSLLAMTSPINQDYERAVTLWDPATGSRVGQLGEHDEAVWSLAFSPDAELLYTASADDTIVAWDVATGGQQMVFTGHQQGPFQWIATLEVDESGERLVSSSTDRSVRVWDTATGAILDTYNGHDDWVNTASFRPNDRTIASGSSDRTVRFWAQTGSQRINLLDGFSGEINALVWSPDGQVLAIASGDEALTLWDYQGSTRTTIPVREAE